MDNLELLKQLPNESISLIYCDILYNTGKKFKDYDDRLGTPQEAMEWYKPRLIEMKRVLKNDGNILLQMDYRLVHYLKVEMDNIFGINNFINEIIWYYKSPSGTSTKKLANKHDNILLYSNGKDFKINIDELREEYSEGTKKQAKNKNVTIDEDTWALSELLQWLFRSAIREHKEINIYIPSERMRELLLEWLNS